MDEIKKILDTVDDKNLHLLSVCIALELACVFSKAAKRVFDKLIDEQKEQAP